MPARIAPKNLDDRLVEHALRAETRGDWVLLYTSLGPLGGRLMCWRCGAEAVQPDLIEHRLDCDYVVRAR
jgi:hypothetical protein